MITEFVEGKENRRSHHRHRGIVPDSSEGIPESFLFEHLSDEARIAFAGQLDLAQMPQLDSLGGPLESFVHDAGLYHLQDISKDPGEQTCSAGACN